MNRLGAFRAFMLLVSAAILLPSNAVGQQQPIKEQLDTPEAQNGLGCVSCHSIVDVDGSMGQGGFTIMYPPLHRLASSRNPWTRRECACSTVGRNHAQLRRCRHCA